MQRLAQCLIWGTQHVDTAQCVYMWKWVHGKVCPLPEVFFFIEGIAGLHCKNWAVEISRTVRDWMLCHKKIRYEQNNRIWVTLASSLNVAKVTTP